MDPVLKAQVSLGLGTSKPEVINPDHLAIWNEAKRDNINLLDALFDYVRRCKAAGIKKPLGTQQLNLTGLVRTIASAQAKEAVGRLKQTLKTTQLISQFYVSSRMNKKGNPFVAFLLLAPRRNRSVAECLKQLSNSLYNGVLPQALKRDIKESYGKPKDFTASASKVKGMPFNKAQWFMLDTAPGCSIYCKCVKEGVLVRLCFDVFTGGLNAAVESARKIVSTTTV